MSRFVLNEYAVVWTYSDVIFEDATQFLYTNTALILSMIVQNIGFIELVSPAYVIEFVIGFDDPLSITQLYSEAHGPTPLSCPPRGNGPAIASACDRLYMKMKEAG